VFGNDDRGEMLACVRTSTKVAALAAHDHIVEGDLTTSDGRARLHETLDRLIGGRS
jgi:hypothetical protein